MNFKTQISKIHYDKDAKGLFFGVLKFASLFYAVGSGFKNFLYDREILKPTKVNAYVISVGNITTGGVGKTPVVAEIVKYLKSRGEKVAIVSRGYGGGLSNPRHSELLRRISRFTLDNNVEMFRSAQHDVKGLNVISDGEQIFYDAQMAGDEPYWLAENTGAIMITSKNRIAAARYAVEKFGVTHIILDDGFQHRKLHRDLDIVLADSKMLFGNEKLLPAGPLREGLEAFSRIDRLVIVSKDTDHTRAEKLAKIMGKKMKVETSVCRTEPDYIYNIKTDERLAEGSEVTAICAIGQPQQFYDFLKNYNIKNTITFDDHHSYELNDIEKVQGDIITTEKDAVKLQKFGRDNIYALKLKTDIDVENLLSSRT